MKFKSLNDGSFKGNEPNQSENPKTLKDTSFALFMDRFELLSAYLDGEVTADERRQVQQWLDTDPQVQKWYRQLTKVQQSARYLPTPLDAQGAEQFTAQVYQKLDRRRNRRLLAIGGALVTAIAVGVAIHLFPGKYSPTHQMAQNQPSVSEAEDDLIIALNRPLFEMPDGEFQNGKQ